MTIPLKQLNTFYCQIFCYKLINLVFVVFRFITFLLWQSKQTAVHIYLMLINFKISRVRIDPDLGPRGPDPFLGQFQIRVNFDPGVFRAEKIYFLNLYNISDVIINLFEWKKFLWSKLSGQLPLPDYFQRRFDNNIIWYVRHWVVGYQFIWFSVTTPCVYSCRVVYVHLRTVLIFILLE